MGGLPREKVIINQMVVPTGLKEYVGKREMVLQLAN